MDEKEWLSSQDPHAMLQYLQKTPPGQGPAGRRGHPLATERKLRLFGCHCMRLPSCNKNRTNEAAIEAAEAFADGLLSRQEAMRILNDHYNTGILVGDGWPVEMPVWEMAWCLCPERLLGTEDGAERAALLRCIFGNPFRQIIVNMGKDAITAPSSIVFDTSWLSWRGGLIRATAEAIYQERRWDDLPELADMLWEASCDSEEMLRHLHDPGPHVRGCWVLDLLTGRR